MKARMILFSLFFLIISACSFELPFNSHEFRFVRSYKHHEESPLWHFGDIKGDGYDYLIMANPQMQGTALSVLNQQGRSVSQVNIAEGQVNHIKVLSNPTDFSQWIFYSINDGKEVYLGVTSYEWAHPLRRTDRRFEPYPRNDNLMNVPAYSWSAMLQPKLLQDIDGDGRLELVALALDGYSINPRGLMAFDFESGALKWFFQSPSCFTSMLFEDFDGDGQGEFVLGNTAFNNTEHGFNGLDDKNGYIVIVDRHGELKHSERLMSGLSEVLLQSSDVDQDGKPDIFALLLRRGSESSKGGILRLSYDSGKLIRKKELQLPGSPESLIYPEFLLRLSSSSAYSVLVNNQPEGLQLYDDKLNLVASGISGINRLFAVGDFNHNGRKELLARSNDDNILLLDGKLRVNASMPNPYPGKRRLMAELVSTNPDSKPMVVISCESGLSFYEVKRIPILLYLYRLAEAYGLWLAILLLAITIRVLIVLKSREKALAVATSKCATGYLVIDGNNRIRHANKSALNLAIQHQPSADLTNLRDVFPKLSESIRHFRISQVDYEDLDLELGEQVYKARIERLPGYRKRYIIAIAAPPPDVDSEMLNWAETARRLSHHVRRHITNVILALDPLEDATQSSQQEYLQIVRSEIDKIRVFTHAFQRFTEMHSYELKLIDLVPHVEHAIGQIRLPESIKLIRNYNLKSMNAYIEPIRFEEALVNTLNNATEAMPEGGTLHVSIRIFARHKSPKGNLSVLVEVEDTGKGIPAKYMQDIWKPFFTTNQSGTGIGIPETKKILDSMGGILDIQSEEGVGTTVSLWLKGEFDV